MTSFVYIPAGRHFMTIQKMLWCLNNHNCGIQIRSLDDRWVRKIFTTVFQQVKSNPIPYYTNIKRYINQCEFKLFNFSLSRSNKCSVQIFLALIYTHTEKMNLNRVKTFKKEIKLSSEEKLFRTCIFVSRSLLA